MDKFNNKKIVVKLNNLDKIEQILQSSLDEATKNYNQIQNEMQKLSSTTEIAHLETIDEKAKYMKAMNDFAISAQKALALKNDIAKLLVEVVKHSGNIKDALDDMKSGPTTFDIAALQKLANEAASTNETTEKYNIK